MAHVLKVVDGNRVREHEFNLEEGVMFWKSNNRVPPEDMVKLAVDQGFDVDVTMCNEVRDAEMNAFLTEYRKNRANGPTDEERFEARAAFGSGVELVNAVTGHKWTT